MRLNIEISNQTKNRLNKKFTNRVILETLKKSRLKFLYNKNILISIAGVNKKEIKKLNKIYRHQDKITDILSFGEYKNTADLKKEKKSDIFLGELVICYDDTRNYARKNGINFKEELAGVISHGALHLLGFSHGPKMLKIQEEAINILKK